MAPTVETGMSSSRAMAGPLGRSHRNLVILVTRSALMPCLQYPGLQYPGLQYPGAKLRSASAAPPPRR
jgi:hypothetical protein